MGPANMDRIRSILYDLARIVFIGVVIAAAIAAIWGYAHRPTLATFRSAYVAASQDEQAEIAGVYLKSFAPAELISALEAEYGEDECHVQSHPVGRALYRENQNFSASFRMCPNTCAYGCFHGVMMEMFSTDSDTLGGVIDEGTPEEYLAAVRTDAANLCERPEATSVAHPQYCTHGLGHVFTLLAGIDLNASIRSCGVLRSPGAVDSCTSGAFMEYLSNPATMFESLSPGQAPCDRFPDHTRSCYRYKAYRWISVLGGVAPALKACERFGTNRAMCIEAVGRAAATEKILVDKVQFDALCESVTGTTHDQCVQGALVKLFDIHIADIDHACAKVDASYREACARTLVYFKKIVLYDR